MPDAFGGFRGLAYLRGEGLVQLLNAEKKATEADQRRFVETFQRFMVANYAGQFDGFSGQSFVTRGEEPAEHRADPTDPSDVDHG